MAVPGWRATGRARHPHADVDAAARAARRDGAVRDRRARVARRSGGPAPAGRRRVAAAAATGVRRSPGAAVGSTGVRRLLGAAVARTDAARSRDAAGPRTGAHRGAAAGPTAARRVAGRAVRAGPAVRGTRVDPRRPGADAYAGTGAPRRRRPAPGLLVATAGADARDGARGGGTRPSGSCGRGDRTADLIRLGPTRVARGATRPAPVGGSTCVRLLPRPRSPGRRRPGGRRRSVLPAWPCRGARRPR